MQACLLTTCGAKLIGKQLLIRDFCLIKTILKGNPRGKFSYCKENTTKKMSTAKSIFNPCRIVAIVLPLLGIILVGVWWMRENSEKTVKSESTVIDISTADVAIVKSDKKDAKSFAHFNRKWHR